MRQQGFTLIEILVALMIFAILSVIVAGCLHHVLNENQRIASQQKTIHQLLKTEMTLRTDVLQMVPKSTTDIHHHIIKPIESLPKGMDFIRTGVVNPDSYYARNSFERVRYVLKNHRLLRILRKHPVILLNHVDVFQIRYLDRQNRYYDHWPLSYRSNAERINASPLPKAIAVRIHIEKMGEWHWLFPILGGMNDDT